MYRHGRGGADAETRQRLLYSDIIIALTLNVFKVLVTSPSGALSLGEAPVISFLRLNHLQIKQIYRLQSFIMLTKEGSRQLLTSQTPPPLSEQMRLGLRACRPGFALRRRPARLLLRPLGLRERLRDWFILVHHLPHQSFTWDCEDDKSESLMWSKVSGSEPV